ncbi:MAG: Flp pilus assembly complex ATPase component TadA [Anaerolineales bacterium]|nr:Flp pilus assembly complex ATPase component TadA [Anaerolineales bacterium]
MSQSVLPFSYQTGGAQCDHGAGCTLQSVLPLPLREACDQADFLADYLHHVPLGDIGIPVYYPKLSRKLQSLERRNLIYPIDGGLFVHIYPDAVAARDHYVSIEPTVMVDLDEVMTQIDERLVEWAEDIGQVEDEDEKKEVLLKLLDQICTTQPPVANGRGNGNGNGRSSKSSNGSRSKLDPIYVTPQQMEGVRYRVLRDKVGLGPLQPLLLDPYIEDISCSGVGAIFVEHKIFKSLQTTISFETMDQLDDFAVWLGEWIKSPVTVRNPIVDAVLPDGSRINIVYGREISKRGSNFTIRKFGGTPTSILELIEFGTLDYTMAAYLSLILEEGMNLFVVGATASGKTTTLNAINTFILPEAKIITIEDTPEVMVPHKNWIREVTRDMGREATGSSVGMFDLLKAALRQRPDRIIVGEIRGEEGRIAFQAMQTGRGVMSTFHAASVEKLIQRLTGDPISVPKTYIDNLNVAIVQSAVRLADKKMARRILSINEIIGYDPYTESFSFLEAFRWNPANDTFEFPGYMNSFLLEERIAMKRGIPPHKRKMVYTELKRRATVFQRLHKEKGVRGFDDFFQILAEAHRQKLL